MGMGALVLRWPPATLRQTVTRRTKKEIIRLLKRAFARDIFRYLTAPVAVPNVSDLQSAQHHQLTTGAEHCGPAVVC